MFLFSSRRRQTSCALVTGVQTCALPIFLEAHGVLVPVAEDAQLQPFRQRVDDRDADPVQAARYLVGLAVELPASMELSHDDLGRRDPLRRMQELGSAPCRASVGQYA